MNLQFKCSNNSVYGSSNLSVAVLLKVVVLCGNDLILAAAAATALSFLIFFLLPGIVLEVKSLFHPLESHQAYNDVYYWGVPDENDGDEDAAAGDEIIQEKAKEYQMNTFSDLSATEVTLP